MFHSLKCHFTSVDIDNDINTTSIKQLNDILLLSFFSY